VNPGRSLWAEGSSGGVGGCPGEPGRPAAPCPAGLGIYVHVPFCRDRCDYCAYAVVVGQEHLAARWAAGIRAELAGLLSEGVRAPGGSTPAAGAAAGCCSVGAGELAEALAGGAASVYLGGGTPSRLAPALVGEVLAALPRRPDAEVTLEANPEDVHPGVLEAWQAAGVTRVSLGVQALSGPVLAALGRRQEPGAGLRAAEALGRCGLASYGVDLVVGSPAETEADLRRALERLVGLAVPPAQVSCYLLTVEPRTALARDPARWPDEARLCDRYELVDEVLGAAGYRWVEISSWARPGGACRHNQAIWAGGEYLGLGPSAASHLGGRRWWNERSLRRWLAALQRGCSVVAGGETLERSQVALERLVLSLRTPRGVPRAALAGALAARPELASLVEERGERLVLTRRGRLLCDALAVHLDPAACPVSSPG